MSLLTSKVTWKNYFQSVLLIMGTVSKWYERLSHGDFINEHNTNMYT
jgi:hypothetical protein